MGIPSGRRLNPEKVAFLFAATWLLYAGLGFQDVPEVDDPGPPLTWESAPERASTRPPPPLAEGGRRDIFRWSGRWKPKPRPEEPIGTGAGGQGKGGEAGDPVGSTPGGSGTSSGGERGNGKVSEGSDGNEGRARREALTFRFTGYAGLRGGRRLNVFQELEVDGSTGRYFGAARGGDLPSVRLRIVAETKDRIILEAEDGARITVPLGGKGRVPKP